MRKTSGAESLVDALNLLNVEVVFAITGAGNLALLDEIQRSGRIRVYFLHHEQAVVMAAQGYSRVSNRIGVAIVTTGGGTSNAMTGILSAHLDSIPVLVVSGNESSFHCADSNATRSWGVQGFDSVRSFANISKASTRLKKGDCPFQQTQQLVELALADRMGPVHLDFPMDLQRSVICPEDCRHVKESDSNEILDNNGEQISELIRKLSSASRPMFYIGNGCRRERTSIKLHQLINNLQIPFFLSWSAIDLFPEEHPLNMGRVGIYGERSSNLILQKADLVVCLGTRLAIPQVGYDKRDFARGAEVWVVDIESIELEKFAGLGWHLIQSDVFHVLSQIEREFSEEGLSGKNNNEDWRTSITKIRRQFPRYEESEIGFRNNSYVHSVDVITFLNKELNDDATIVTDVGAGLLSGHYAYEQQGVRRIFTSQGLGEMGFGLPASIGAYLAEPNRQLVCLNTDGAIMFNLQELQSVSHLKIPLKLFVFNNKGYAMIKISQGNLFDGREFGSTLESGISFPSFESLAKTFDFDYFHLANSGDLGVDLVKILRNSRPTLIEVMMDPEQKYLPRLATSKKSDGTLVSPPIEDLDPKISYELLLEILGGAVHESSKGMER